MTCMTRRQGSRAEHQSRHRPGWGRSHRPSALDALLALSALGPSPRHGDSEGQEVKGKVPPPSRGWVIRWTTCPLSNYMVLPKDVATILGCTREELAELRRPQRAIAFLARPDHALRVVGMHRHADIVGKALAAHEVVGISQVTPTNVTFNIPDAVEAYMGLRTYRRTRKSYVVTGTDDTVAWIVPASEYYPFRRAGREGKPWVQPEGGSHVYFRKSFFPGLLPNLAELEKS